MNAVRSAVLPRPQLSTCGPLLEELPVPSPSLTAGRWEDAVSLSFFPQR
jgi:hypothetical protein